MFLSVVVRRPSCDNNYHFNLFLKTTRQIITNFSVKHLFGKRNLIVKFMNLTPPPPPSSHGATGEAKYAKTGQIFKHLLLDSHTCEEKLHGYDVHTCKALYLNYISHCKSQGFRL